MKSMKIKVKPKQHYQSKMTKDELQEHLKMIHNGASKTKNKKKQIARKTKYKKNLMKFH